MLHLHINSVLEIKLHLHGRPVKSKGHDLLLCELVAHDIVGGYAKKCAHHFHPVGLVQLIYALAPHDMRSRAKGYRRACYFRVFRGHGLHSNRLRQLPTNESDIQES